MPSNASIRRSIIIFILCISSILVLSYSVMMGYYLISGLDLSTEYRLRDEAQNYAARFQEDPGAQLPRSAHLNAYADYAALPAAVRSRFQKQDLQPDMFTQHQSNGAHYFIYTFKRPDGAVVYFIFHFLEEEMSERAIRRFNAYLFYAPATVGGVTILLVLGLSVFMLRRVARPVEDLRNWAFALDLDSVESRTPDFKYEELNQLGELFSKAVSRLGEGIEREKRFQRYASHELRTPIAVLQNNLELMERLGIGEHDRFTSSYQRMDKAVENMRHLTTTLLWVSREEYVDLPGDEIELHAMITEIIDESSYLLVGKDVSLDMALSQASVHAPLTVARIIISNIVRNAFQHTYEGGVRIRLEQGRLVVDNNVNPDANSGETSSHGLGLALITQLTEKLGWDLELVEEGGRFSVTLGFGE